MTTIKDKKYEIARKDAEVKKYELKIAYANFKVYLLDRLPGNHAARVTQLHKDITKNTNICNELRVDRWELRSDLHDLQRR